MKYFTPELYALLQDPEPSAMDRADTQWQEATSDYEQRLAAIGEKLPPSARKLLGTSRFHDAEVLWMGQAGPFFGVLLLMDGIHPTTELLSYRLAESVDLHDNRLPRQIASSVMQWLYDEVDLGTEANQFRHSVLFSDGSELAIEASEVQITSVDTLYAPTLANQVSA